MTTKIKKFLKSESGFTLIELLVVIGIIAILATIGAVNFSGARAKARDAKRTADITQVKAAVEGQAAGSVNGLYPNGRPTDLPATGYNPPQTNDSYCYTYDNTNDDDFVVSVVGIESADVAASGINTDTIAIYTAALGYVQVNIHDAGLGAACALPVDCDAADVYCLTGATTL